MFAIILIKLLQYGSAVNEDMNLYNTKTKQLDVSAVECEHLSYRQLIQFCLHPQIVASAVAAFVRSICAHEFTSHHDKAEGIKDLVNSDMKDLAALQPE